MLAPMGQAAREATRRATCVNNMKHLGLAMHNYHELKGSFPPAVLLGPDGKTPHSWRVALLPLLETDGAKELYSRYKFDEPWDGPNNSKLIPLIPEVYRHPEAPGETQGPGLTAYFVRPAPTRSSPG